MGRDFTRRDAGIRSGNGPSAVVTESNYAALLLLADFARHGLRVPDDVAVVGWGNETIGQWLNRGLTTVNYRLKDVVGQALDLLGETIERPEEIRPRTVVIKPELVVRESA